MKLSTKGRYGTRAMVDIAVHGSNDGPVLLKDIARRQEISEGYLEHLMASLKAAGLVKSERGAKGGYYLAKPATQITAGDILDSLEGPFFPADCVERASVCQRNKICVTRDLWIKMRNAVCEVMESTTLQDLAEQHKKKSRKKVPMYHI